MEYILKKYSDIKDIDPGGITFKNGETISFEECLRQRYNSSTCIAERDISAATPYFEFFTPQKPTRVVFNKIGFFNKKRNHDDFIRFQLLIDDLGYSTYDLS